MENKGYIYILTNPSFKEYIKIGYADNVENRLRQLNNSECIPFAFRVYATYEVEDRLTDVNLHKLIDQLNPNLRSIDNVNGKKRVREFYAMSPETAYNILEGIAEINGLLDNLFLNKKESDDEKICFVFVSACSSAAFGGGQNAGGIFRPCGAGQAEQCAVFRYG